MISASPTTSSEVVRMRCGRAVTAVALVSALLGPLLSGCGSQEAQGARSGDRVAGKSADAILTEATRQLTSRRAVRVTGQARDGGSALTLDVSYVGSGARGTVAVDGPEIQVLKAGQRVWFKGGNDFYRSVAGKDADAFIKVVGGRWIALDKGAKGFESFGELLDRRRFLGGLARRLQGDHVRAGTVTTVAGVRSVPLQDASGTLWVNAEDGSLVRLRTDEGERLDFSYRRAKPVRAPRPAEIYHLPTTN